MRAGLREREEERRRWARELHDETLQELAAVQLLLTCVRQTASRRLRSGDPLLTSLDSAIALLAGQIASLRYLITELRPAALDQLGLGPPLLALAERTQTFAGLEVVTDVRLRYEDGEAPTRLLPDIELAIYRVVQEALTNASRHSGAARVRVSVREGAECVRVEVADDGRGSRPVEGLGLAGMRERAALAGGSLEVVSAPGTAATSHGTLIRLVVPADHRSVRQVGDRAA